MDYWTFKGTGENQREAEAAKMVAMRIVVEIAKTEVHQKLQKRLLLKKYFFSEDFVALVSALAFLLLSEKTFLDSLKTEIDTFELQKWKNSETKSKMQFDLKAGFESNNAK